MRLPKGSLTGLTSKTGISNTRLCDYISTRTRPGRKRALELEEAGRELGVDIPATLWLYGTSEEIKSRFFENYKEDAPHDHERRQQERRAEERRAEERRAEELRRAERRRVERRKNRPAKNTNQG